MWMHFCSCLSLHKSLLVVPFCLQETVQNFLARVSKLFANWGSGCLLSHIFSFTYLITTQAPVLYFPWTTHSSGKKKKCGIPPGMKCHFISEPFPWSTGKLVASPLSVFPLNFWTHLAFGEYVLEFDQVYSDLTLLCVSAISARMCTFSLRTKTAGFPSACGYIYKSKHRA